MYIKDLLLPENIQQSIEETNEKKRMADINQQIDQKQAESKAQNRVSFVDDSVTNDFGILVTEF